MLLRVLPRHMRQSPGLIQKALKLSRWHPHRIVCPAVAPAAAANGTAFQIAPQRLRQLRQRFGGRIKLRGLQIQRAGVDDLLILQDCAAAVGAGIIAVGGVKIPLLRLRRRGIGHRHAAGICVFPTAAAGSQRENHGQGKDPCKELSFHRSILLLTVFIAVSCIDRRFSWSKVPQKSDFFQIAGGLPFFPLRCTMRPL